MPDDAPKTLGPYQLLEEIGRGGMGVVYKAFHPQLKRTVALKVLIAGEDASEEALTRFHREAEAVGKLGHHPNIVPVYDIGQVTREHDVGAQHAAPLHYFAMHFVEGKSLDRMIEDGEIAPKRAAVITKKLAEALAHAHENGILHRDVKPSNVIIAELEGESGRGGDGGNMSPPPPLPPSPPRAGLVTLEPMLTDFGLAKDIQSESKMTRSGVTLGTPNYMPPEQAEGRLSDIDERSDVYALGATFYEMLTTRPPFEGASVAEVIQRVFFHEPVPPRRLNRLVKKDMETICLKCLEKEPARRYAGARELAEDLELHLRGDPILARPASAWDRISRKARRNKAAAAILAVLAVTLLAGGWLGIQALTATERAKGEAAEESRRAEKMEARAETAEALLEKRQKVSAVLQSADRELGEVLRAMKQVYHGFPAPEDLKASRDRHWAKVEAFGRTVPADTASQATWLAAKGWLAFFAGEPKTAFDLFKASREADGDVVYGGFFESVLWLTIYFRNRRWPTVHYAEFRPHFGPMPPETEEMREALRKCEKALVHVQDRDVWGESAAEEFRAVLSGLRALRKRDLETADRALSRALAIPEMRWMADEILLMRVKIRFIRGDLEGGIADGRRLLERLPEITPTHFNLGVLHFMRALEENGKGNDPRPLFKEAIEACTRAIEREGRTPILPPRITRGIIHASWGLYVDQLGGDPRPFYEKALADYEVPPGTPLQNLNPANNRGNVLVNLAGYLEEIGADPSEAFERAIEEYTAALRRSPRDPEVLWGRAVAHHHLGRAVGYHGGDPSVMYRSAKK
ncbi:MAG: protein kinase domain-containing protein, partial [Planctomycetota bacterium]